MEALIEKYGFNEGQINDIKRAVTDSINMILPNIIKEITPLIVENYRSKIKSEKEQLEDINRTRKKAMIYYDNNANSWRYHLRVRHNKYWSDFKKL